MSMRTHCLSLFVVWGMGCDKAKRAEPPPIDSAIVEDTGPRPEPATEDCTNRIDDDDDGLIDCSDPDCADESACSEDCTNEIDDDADGLIDCDDPECADDPACPEDCANEIDDDADGLIDCSDPECTDEPTCPEDCANGIDDDADGLIDCDDPECADDPACPEDCTNEIDDDTDGLIDCDDPECWVDGVCPELCTNGIDDDGDALTDCEDADCLGHRSCAEACGDGIDNDYDGLIDCDDDECWPYCADVRLQVTAASGAGVVFTRGRRTSLSGFSSSTGVYGLSGSIDTLQGLLSLERASTTSPVQCTWTATGLQVTYMESWSGRSFSRSTASRGSAQSAHVSSSGACPVHISSVFPTRMGASLSLGQLVLRAPLPGGGSTALLRLDRGLHTVLRSSTSRSTTTGGRIEYTFDQSQRSTMSFVSGGSILFEDAMVP